MTVMSSPVHLLCVAMSSCFIPWWSECATEIFSGTVVVQWQLLHVAAYFGHAEAVEAGSPAMNQLAPGFEDCSYKHVKRHGVRSMLIKQPLVSDRAARDWWS